MRDDDEHQVRGTGAPGEAKPVTGSNDHVEANISMSRRSKTERNAQLKTTMKQTEAQRQFGREKLVLQLTRGRYSESLGRTNK